MTAYVKKYGRTRMYYSDILDVCQDTGIHEFDLWWPIPKFTDPYDTIPFTTDDLVFRYLFQNFAVDTVRKAFNE